MHLEQCLCRYCRRPYSLDEGCEMCQGARDNMIKPPIEDSFKETPLTPIIQQLIRILQINAAQLENEFYLGRHKKDQKADINKSKFDREYFQTAMQLLKSSTGIISEARKMEAQFSSTIDKMSLEEKLELAMAMLENFPRHLQLQAFNQVSKMVGETPLLVEPEDEPGPDF